MSAMKRPHDLLKSSPPVKAVPNSYLKRLPLSTYDYSQGQKPFGGPAVSEKRSHVD